MLILGQSEHPIVDMEIVRSLKPLARTPIKDGAGEKSTSRRLQEILNDDRRHSPEKDHLAGSDLLPGEKAIDVNARSDLSACHVAAVPATRV
jgi:hypothetical protein